MLGLGDIHFSQMWNPVYLPSSTKHLHWQTTTIESQVSGKVTSGNWDVVEIGCATQVDPQPPSHTWASNRNAKWRQVSKMSFSSCSDLLFWNRHSWKVSLLWLVFHIRMYIPSPPIYCETSFSGTLFPKKKKKLAVWNIYNTTLITKYNDNTCPTALQYMRLSHYKSSDVNRMNCTSDVFWGVPFSNGFWRECSTAVNSHVFYCDMLHCIKNQTCITSAFFGNTLYGSIDMTALHPNFTKRWKQTTSFRLRWLDDYLHWTCQRCLFATCSSEQQGNFDSGREHRLSFPLTPST